MIDELSQLAETYIICTIRKKRIPKALLIITGQQRLISIHLDGQKIGRRDSLDYYRWLNARLGSVAYAYITSVVSVGEEADAKPRPEFLVHVSSVERARHLNFSLNRGASNWRSFLGDQKVTELFDDQVSQALFYFFKPPQMNLFKGFRFGREFGRLLKSEAIRDWWERDPSFWDGTRIVLKRIGQWSSDQTLIFSGVAPSERLGAFAQVIGVNSLDEEAASLMSIAALYRIEYLAPRPLSEMQRGFAIVALTDSFSQWLNVNWDETMRLCFSRIGAASMLMRGEPTAASWQKSIQDTHQLQRHCCDLQSVFPELAQSIGQGPKDSIIRNDERQLREGAGALARTMLF